MQWLCRSGFCAYGRALQQIVITKSNLTISELWKVIFENLVSTVWPQTAVSQLGYKIRERASSLRQNVKRPMERQWTSIFQKPPSRHCGWPLFSVRSTRHISRRTHLLKDILVLGDYKECQCPIGILNQLNNLGIRFAVDCAIIHFDQTIT